MKWHEIRKMFKDRWVLVEATKAHSENHFRILDELEVVADFDDSPEAFAKYKKEHHQAPLKELFVFHTSRETLEIEERSWVGVRV